MLNSCLVTFLLIIGCIQFTTGMKYRTKDLTTKHESSISKKIIIVESPEKGWNASKKSCEDMGKKFLTLPSYSDVVEVAKLLPDTNWYWIGGHCPGCTNDKQDKWVWTTGEKIPLNNKYFLSSGLEDAGYQHRAIAFSKSGGSTANNGIRFATWPGEESDVERYICMSH